MALLHTSTGKSPGFMLNTVYHIAGMLLYALLTVVSSQIAEAQPVSGAAQHLSLEVAPVTRFAVSGDPGSLFIYLTPGMRSSREVEDASSTYSMTTNKGQMKIMVSIDKVMPQGMHLFVEIASERGESSGRIEISRAVVPVVAVTGIRRGGERNSRITYTYTVDSSIDYNLLDSRIVMLTLTE